MKNKNSARESGLFTVCHADGETARRTMAREIWDPEARCFRPLVPGDIPMELYELKYPDCGFNRADRYQTKCLNILKKADSHEDATVIQHRMRAYSSVNAVTGMSAAIENVAMKAISRERWHAKTAIARLRATLANRPELLSLLDSFDTSGDGRFDFAAVAAKHKVSLATAYRWRGELAKAARQPTTHID